MSPSQTQALPSWLQLGLHLHALRKRGDEEGWERAIAASNERPQTLNRFVRLAAFLETHYPEVLRKSGGFQAGSAVMLEFIQLHALSIEQARLEAPDCFHGITSVRTLRSRVGHLREELARHQKASSRSSNQRYADFTRSAFELLHRNPHLLGLGPIKSLEISDVRSTLMPKLVAHCKKGPAAIDVRAPDVTAARSLSAAAASYASRIAVLRLRFDQVVIVMPGKAQLYAEETLKLLHGWAKAPAQVLSNVNFLMVIGDTGQLLDKARVLQGSFE
ncbi:hypothetical protein [Thiomonas sp. OC7]|uniref:hypothetical protein n=1 Tax=Thiomonas sp. OC7 TaxID=2493107 RepID=UPI0012DCE2CB|nr:hypothetical protein [Thiomonas sp. OC7]